MKRVKWLAFVLSLLMAVQGACASAVMASDTEEASATETPVTNGVDGALDYIPAPEEMVNDSNESNENELAANEVGATLAGVIPSDLKVTSSILSEEQYPDALKATLASDEEMDFYGAFDITLYDKSGAEWQPEEDKPVLVSVDASLYGLKDGDNFVVMHYHADGTPEAMGPFVVENGQANFHTTGFSSFAFVSGGTDTNYHYMNPNNGYGAYRTYYLHNGHTVNLYRPAGVSGMTWNKLSDTAGGLFSGYYAGDYSLSFNGNFAHGSHVKYLVNGVYLTIYFMGNPYDMSDGSYGSPRVFYVKPGQQITFPGTRTYSTIQSGGSNTNGSFSGQSYTNGWLAGGSDSSAYYYVYIGGIEVRIITVAANGSDAPADSLTHNSSAGITMRCLMYPQNGFPAAGIAHPDIQYNFITMAQGYTNAYISSSICGSMGHGSWSGILQAGSYQLCYDNYIYQNTSGNIKNYTPSIQYDGLIASLVNRGVYDWTGNVLGSNTGDFTLVPYAIRFLMDGPTAGWTIDCYLAPKRTLSYNLNAPATPSSLGTPSGVVSNPVYGGSWTTTSVAATPALNSQHSMTNGTAYIFLGWATSASGAVAYNPGASITVSSNIVLYGKWQQVTLTITYNVNPPGTPSPGITTPTAYTAGTVNGQISTSAPSLTVNSPHDMGGGNYYSFLGWSTSSSATSATYAPGATVAVSTNTTLYGVWEIVILDFDLTITVAGADLTLDPEQSFVFRLQGVSTEDETIDLTFMINGNGTVTISSLPRGNYAISGSAWAWRYGNVTGTDGVYDFGALQSDTSLTYQVSRTNTRWLDDNSYAKAP